MIDPRQFRITAWFCLAILALDTVVSQLPHSHAHHSATCTHGSCAHSPASHSACNHHHASCTHSHACTHHACEHSQPAKSSETPTEPDGPCDHCTLCRHQAQAALTCTVVAPPVFHATCELLPDQQIPQLTPTAPHVYQGRGPPAWL